MDLTTSMRVGAVGNAFCAFSKELVDAVCASTAPAASTRGISSGPPNASGFDAMATFIQTAQTDGTEIQVPESLVNRFKPDILVNQDGADGEHTAAPRDATGGTDPANFVVARVL